MSEPSSIADYRQRRAHSCVPPAHVDNDGREWFTYSVSYTDQQGMAFTFRILALSFEDAEQRLDAVRTTGRVDGALVESFPA